MKVQNIGFKGIGSYIPNTIIRNDDIDKLDIGTNAEWTYKNLGIRERRISDDEEFASDLGIKAVQNAIDDAKLNINDIDLMIVSTSSPDRIAPSTASIMAKKMNINIPVFDINAVCTGFVYGIQIATNLIKSGAYKNILLVATETYSKITDWKHRNSIFFGDGAGAVVISHTNEGWIATDIYGDIDIPQAFTCYHDSKFDMNGSGVYTFATTVLPRAIKIAFEKYNLKQEDIKWMIPHQPGHRILFKTSELLNFPLEKIIFNMEKHANTASASIPMALDKLYKEGNLNNGDILMLPSVGAGWTYGVSIVKFYK
jgi:3-oxoacyl-[acyl-carrier-protein] synthase-3